MNKKIFVHKYIKRFVYVCVTALGCIIGHNVGMSNKIFMYKYVKIFVYIHVTGLGYIRLCGCMRFVRLCGCMRFVRDKVIPYCKRCATELVTRHLCMNMLKGLYRCISQG